MEVFHVKHRHEQQTPKPRRAIPRGVPDEKYKKGLMEMQRKMKTTLLIDGMNPLKMNVKTGGRSVIKINESRSTQGRLEVAPDRLFSGGYG
jgi:hypothetical protein